jgi:hypothetical protein
MASIYELLQTSYVFELQRRAWTGFNEPALLQVNQERRKRCDIDAEKIGDEA